MLKDTWKETWESQREAIAMSRTSRKYVNELLTDADVVQLGMKEFADNWQGLPEELVTALKNKRKQVNSQLMKEEQLVTKWLNLWTAANIIYTTYKADISETRLLDHIKLTLAGAKSRHTKHQKRADELYELRQRIDNSIGHYRDYSNT